MTYLLDTDVVSALRRRNCPKALCNFVDRHDEECFVSVVTWAELAFGASLVDATFHEELSEWLVEMRDRFSEGTEWLDEETLVRWKRLLADLKTRNVTMAAEDSLIAATALRRGHTVCTFNEKHFAAAQVPVLAFSRSAAGK
jgi:toxin FitB